jgi:hypothetical protein
MKKIIIALSFFFSAFFLKAQIITDPGVIAISKNYYCNSEYVEQIKSVSLATATSGTITYSWEWRYNGGTTWYQVLIDKIPVTSINYTPNQYSVSAFYRRIAKVGTYEAYSNEVEVARCLALTGGTISIPSYSCYNEKISISNSQAPKYIIEVNTEMYSTTKEINYNGDIPLTYLWQESNNDGITWSDITETTSSSYTTTVQTNSKKYRRKAWVCYAYEYSNSVESNVSPVVSIGEISGDETICYNTVPNNINSVSLPTGGNDSWSYQWYKSIDNSAWQTISNANFYYYIPSTLHSTSTWYKRKDINNCSENSYTNSIKKTVEDELSPAVIINYKNDYFCSGANAYTTQNCWLRIESYEVGGKGTSTIQTQHSTNKTSWSNTPGNWTLEIEYSLDDQGDKIFYLFKPNLTLTETTYFRRVYSNDCGTVYSNVISKYVVPTVNPGSIIGPDKTCAGESPGVIENVVAASNDGYIFTYSWYTSLDNSNWSQITGSASSYQPPVLTTKTYYKRRATGNCNNTYSNTISVDIESPLVVPSIGSDETVCYNNSPGMYAVTPTGGGGNYTYQWYNSTTSATSGFTEISGATGANYTVPNLTTNYYLYCQVGSSCSSQNTNTVSISVQPNFVVGTISGNATICYNSNAGTISGSSPSGGGKSYSFQWYKSTTNPTSGFTAISGATSQSYAPGTLTQTTYFKRLDKASCNSSGSYTNVVTINVNADVSAGTLSVSNNNICYNSNAGTISGTMPTGGGGNYTYQWYKSTTNSTSGFTAISGATSQSYAPGTLTQTTFFKRLDKASCNSSGKYTDVLTITVIPQLSAGSISIVGSSTEQTICYNTTPDNILGIAPTGGNAGYIYQWQSKLGDGSWTNIAGAQSFNYQPGFLTLTTQYRRLDNSNCSPTANLATNTITVTVSADLAIGSISPATQQICYGDTPVILSGSNPSGGQGSYSYKWKSSTDLVTWNDLASSNTAVYQPAAITTKTYFKREVTSACKTSENNYVEVNVYSAGNGGSVGSDQTICYGKTPLKLNQLSAPNGDDNSFTYKWQKQNGVTWEDVSNVTTAEYQPPALLMDTYYRRVVSSACNVYINTPIQILVSPEFYGGSIGSDQTIYYNTIPSALSSIIAPSGGSGSYSYQWWASYNNATWSKISDATTADYAPGNLTLSTYFKRVVTDDVCGDQIENNTVSITVYETIDAGTIGSNQSICFNVPPNPITTLTAPSGDGGSYSIAWQKSTNDGYTWSGIMGETDPTYQPPALLQSTLYRKEVEGATLTAYSNVVRIDVALGLYPGTIVSNQICCYDAAPELISYGEPASGGIGPIAYSWEYSYDNATYSTIPDADDITYLPPANNTKTWYQRIASNTCGSVSTNSLVVYYYNPLNPGSIGIDQAITYNILPNEIQNVDYASGGTGSLSYEWKKSFDGSTWTTIPSSNTANYQPPTLTKTTYYKRLAKNSCGEAESNVITIFVYDQLTGGEIASSQSVCYNTSPTALNQTVEPSGGNESYSYQWESSPDNSNWSTVFGANSNAYQPPVLTSGTYYRRMVIAGVGGIAFSNTVWISVYDPVNAGTIGAAETICFGDVPPTINTVTPPSGGGNNYTVTWVYSPNNFSWLNIPSNDIYSYSHWPLTESTYFRKTVSNSCGSLSTPSVLISVNPEFNPGQIGDNQIIAYNAIPDLIEDFESATGGSGTITYSWKKSLNQSNWSTISGATGLSYQPSALLTSSYFKRLASNDCGNDQSNTVYIEVFPQLIAPVINASQSICRGSAPETITQSSPALGGDEQYIYTWEKSEDNSSWSEITGIYTDFLKPGGLAVTTLYRCKVSANIGGYAYSNTITIAVYDPLMPGSIADNQSICFNLTAAQINTFSPPSSGSGSYSNQWQRSLNNLFWEDMPGETNSYLASSEKNTSLYFRKKVSDACESKYTNSVFLEYYDEFIPGEIYSDQSIAFNSTPERIESANDASGGDENITYKWQQSTNLSTWSFRSGETDVFYQPTNLTQTTYYKRIAYNACGQEESNIVTIEVYPLLTSGSIGSAQSVCFNTAPNRIISLSFPTGGDGNYSYAWESSKNNVDWSVIAGAFNDFFEPPMISESTYFRRISSANVGGFAYSNAVLITVYPPFDAGSIGSSSTICYGSTAPQIYTLTAPTGGNAMYTSSWEYSFSASFFDVVSGASGNSYSPGPLFQSTFFRKKVSNMCGEDTTNTILVSVSTPISPGQIGPDQIIAYNTSPALIENITSAFGGAGTLTYAWRKSADLSTWLPVSGSDSSYQPGKLLETTYFKRLVSNTCGSSESNFATIEVYPQLTAGLIGASQSICYGSAPELLQESTIASGGDGNYAYQWESSCDNITYAEITGATAASFQSLALTSTTYFRRKITAGVGGSAYSNVITITVYPVLVAGSISGNQNLCDYANPTIISNQSAASGGYGSFAYTWLYSTNNAQWYGVASANNADYLPGHLAQTTYFKRVATNTCGSANSNAVTILMYDSINPGNIGIDQVIAYNTIPNPVETVELPSGGSGDFSFTWKKSLNGTTWTTVTGENEPIYQPTSLTQTTYFKRIASNNCGSRESNFVTIQVYPQLTAGQIAASHSICSGEAPLRIEQAVAPYGGDGNYAYQWENSSNNTDWLIIVGATDSVFQPPVLTQSTYYRRKLTAGLGGSAYSNVVLISIYPATNVGLIGIDQTICNASAPLKLDATTNPSGGNGLFTHAWYYSENGTSWDSIPNTNALAYQAPVLTQTTYFKRLTTSACNSGFTNSITITVYDEFKPGIIGYAHTIAYNSTPNALFQIEAPTGGSGSNEFQWQYSNDSISFYDIPYAIWSDYQPEALSSTKYYRKKISNSCASDFTNTLKINVLPQLIAGSVSGNQTICFNASPEPLKESNPACGGDGIYAYQWQSSIDGTYWQNINSANAFEYQPNNLNETSYFKRLVTSFSTTTSSNVLTVVVRDEIAQPVLSFKEVYCKGETVNITASGSTGNYKWFTQYDDFIKEGYFLRFENIQNDSSFNIIAVHSNGCNSTSLPFQLITDKITAYFETELTSIYAGNPLKFYDYSINASAWQWNFNDGDKSFVQNPWHYFNNDGEYTVSLTVISPDNCLDSLTRLNYISVLPAINDIDDIAFTVQIYPVPASDVLYVNMSFTDDIFLFNAYGQLLDHFIQVPGALAINLSQMNQGIYFIQIRNKNYKIVKQ